jgi:hypothetical protein
MEMIMNLPPFISPMAGFDFIFNLKFGLWENNIRLNIFNVRSKIRYYLLTNYSFTYLWFYAIGVMQFAAAAYYNNYQCLLALGSVLM